MLYQVVRIFNTESEKVADMKIFYKGSKIKLYVNVPFLRRNLLEIYRRAKARKQTFFKRL